MNATLRSRVIVVTTLLVLGVGALAVPAAAHADFIGADPHDGANLHELPGAVRLEFSDGMDPGLSTVTLQAGDGESIPLDLTNGAKPTVLVASVPGTPAPEVGTTTRWTVTFRVVSRDGHPVVGTSTFVVRTPASPTTPPSQGSSSATETGSPEPDSVSTEPADAEAADADEPGTGDSNSAWLVAIGVGVLALLVLAVGTVMRLVGRDTET